MQAIFETAFDVLYLSTVIILGVIMLKNNKGKKQYLLFGIMAITLGIGDAFHLIPRAYALCTTGLQNHIIALGLGKLITSISMTAFYVLLYYVWLYRYKTTDSKCPATNSITASIWVLAIARIVLCLFPQNQWFSNQSPIIWGIYRNVPFTLLGLLIVALYYKSATNNNDIAFKHLWLSIVLSFAFYIPVVLFADTLPLIGMLMIPKTCAYVWTILIGYNAMKGEI